MSADLARLLAIMERLRGADGCPWDRAQTFASIAPYAIEEAYEVADAIERGDMDELKDELGDLLFQVVFQARMAQEAQLFDFDAVAAALCAKLIRRHPHIFGGADTADIARRPITADQQLATWENIKAGERAAAARALASAANPVSALSGVPTALPALLRAHKLSKRAARVGFDFEYTSDTAGKVAEELAEVLEAAAAAGIAVAAGGGTAPRVEVAAGSEKASGIEAAAGSEKVTGIAVAAGGRTAPRVVAESRSLATDAVFEEIGDLLFAAANLARKLDIDAEAALRGANSKFERRFHGMERLAAQRGLRFETLDLAAQEALWQEVKRGE